MQRFSIHINKLNTMNHQPPNEGSWQLWRQFAGFALLIVLAGCGALPIPGTTSDACVADGALFIDTFSSDIECGWVQFDGNDAVEVGDGVMTVQVGTNGVVAWSNPQREFADIELSTLARQVRGPNNNAYGVICRYVDESNFYIFLVSGDGYYAIAKYQSGISQIQYLTGNDPDFFVASDAINTGVASNQIRVRCVGNQLSLFVNGQLLDTVEDSTFTSGDIGIAASSLDDGQVVIEFDNVQVVAP